MSAIVQYSIELARALALLKELLIHAENNDGMDSSVLEPLELASETIGSELFSKLVDAQNSQSKVSECKTDN